MNVGFDSNFLTLILHPGAKPPLDPVTREPLSEVALRMDTLVEKLNKAGDKVIVPTPVLAEFLVLAGNDANRYLSELHNLANIYIRPFDTRAAIELVSFELNARRSGPKRAPLDIDRPWQKVKVDRQIVAIAKVQNVHTLFADDGDLRTLAEYEGLRVRSSWELEIPSRPQDLFSPPPA